MKQISKHRGVTLVEMIIAITLVGIVSGILGSVWLQLSNTNALNRTIVDTTWQARMALFRMEREFGRCTALASGTSFTSLRFIDADGSTVIYQRSGNTLTRNGVQLANHISAFSISGLDNNFATTVAPASVRCININLTVSNQNITTALASSVCPRNLAWSE